VSPKAPTDFRLFDFGKHKKTSQQGKYVWDARRALDYLETRPEVDVSSVGMIGHSLGGQETLSTTAIDTRIRAAVSSCGFANCSNPAFLYPFVISYAVKTRVDTDYQANDLPACIVRLPSPTYPTN